MIMIFVCVCLPIVFIATLAQEKRTLIDRSICSDANTDTWLPCGMRVTFDLPIAAPILQGTFVH